MQIIIPMSGEGQRFIRKGYQIPKPLIKVEGKPIIHHVIDLFPGETNFRFICNKEHILKTDMKKIIKEYLPSAEVITIDKHKKGPVYAVSKIFDVIENNQPTIINYCDFSCYWEYSDFKTYLKNENLDGCIPAYKGFHPHSLGNTNYAYLNEFKRNLIEIKEKEPFTNNRMSEFASSGTYYFSKGEYIKKYFQEAISKNLDTNGEFYCSVVYNLMVADKLKVGVYELEHFMQWGTPEDLEEYKNWSDLFRESVSKKDSDKKEVGTTIIPMAGKGIRFKKEGYKKEKPLIEINQKPMFIHAISSMPKSKKNIFIIKDDISNKVNSELNKNSISENNLVFSLKNTPNGQALTTSKVIDKCCESESINVSACDHAMMYDKNSLSELLRNNIYDIIVWTKGNYVPAIKNPEMYGWVSIEGEKISNVIVKERPKDFKNSQVIVGTFTFRKPIIYQMCLDRLVLREGKINGEYYIDSLIKDALDLGLNCTKFEIDHYICWGTPNELKTFNYWENCFNKWPSHPYKRNNSIW